MTIPKLPIKPICHLFSGIDDSTKTYNTLCGYPVSFNSLKEDTLNGVISVSYYAFKLLHENSFTPKNTYQMCENCLNHPDLPLYVLQELGEE